MVVGMKPRTALAAALLGALLAAPAEAGETTVVELFTSQSCYSCPPAEAYLGELAKRPDLIALEFHVDYWDDLVYGFAGRWKDVFSDPAHTARQHAYNIRIRSRAQSYTPQMVVDGRLQAVGSDRARVESLIRTAALDRGPRLTVAVEGARDGGLRVAVDGARGEPAAVWLVRFVRSRVTDVKAGENKGKVLTNHHAVTSMERIGRWAGEPLTLDVADLGLAADEGCAVLVQDERPGPILGAAACPAPGA